MAAENPEAIIYEPVDINKGIQKDQALKVVTKVGMTGTTKENTAEMLMKMYEIFIKKDALLIEINPYAEDADGSCKYILFNKCYLYKNINDYCPCG